MAPEVVSSSSGPIVHRRRERQPMGRQGPLDTLALDRHRASARRPSPCGNLAACGCSSSRRTRHWPGGAAKAWVEGRRNLGADGRRRTLIERPSAGHIDTSIAPRNERAPLPRTTRLRLSLALSSPGRVVSEAGYEDAAASFGLPNCTPFPTIPARRGYPDIQRPPASHWSVVTMALMSTVVELEVVIKRTTNVE